uniref:Uncharacterized protein n=1 Tax=Oryza barthii TaxID=65489 RepID=A0A0D3HHX7_9ORYZ
MKTTAYTGKNVAVTRRCGRARSLGQQGARLPQCLHEDFARGGVSVPLSTDGSGILTKGRRRQEGGPQRRARLFLRRRRNVDGGWGRRRGALPSLLQREGGGGGALLPLSHRPSAS